MLALTISTMTAINEQRNSLVPSASISYNRKAKKEALEHFRDVIKICSNREHIFQNKLRNTWAVILRTSADLLCYKFRRLVCRTKDKNKTKTYE